MLGLYNNLIARITDNKDRFTALGLLPVETIDLYDGQPQAPEKITLFDTTGKPMAGRNIRYNLNNFFEKLILA